MERFDVAVVGGGPAGATAAAELAAGGVRVALFDDSHPREKPCGGALSGRLLKEFEISQDVIDRKINGLVVEASDGKKIEMRHDFGVVVMRRKFDSHLLKKAIDAGAHHICERVTRVASKNDGWEIDTGKNTFFAETLIGADGCLSVVRRSVLGPIPSEHIGHCVVYHIPHPKAHIDKHFSDTLEIYFPGKQYPNVYYAWIFPKANHITVGIGGELGKNLRPALDDFMARHYATKRILKVQTEIRSHVIPMVSNAAFYRKPITGRNWAIIGDAAGHVNPITGEGIYYAMMDGRLVAASYLAGDMCGFEKLWRRAYGSDMIWGATMQKMFYGRAIDRIISYAQHSKTLRNIIAEIMCPSKSYNKLIWQLPNLLGVPFEIIADKLS